MLKRRAAQILKMKRILFIFLCFFIVLIVAAIFLEFFGKQYQCRANIPTSRDSVQSLIFPQTPSRIQEVIKRRKAGEEIAIKEYQELMEEFVLEVNPDVIPGLNGVVRNNIGYVRNDLPQEAKKYVKRHELEHLLDGGGEFEANIAAAKEYPLGLIETILFSIKDRSKYYDSNICYLVSLWKTFKVYFFPHL